MLFNLNNIIENGVVNIDFDGKSIEVFLERIPDGLTHLVGNIVSGLREVAEGVFDVPTELTDICPYLNFC